MDEEVVEGKDDEVARRVGPSAPSMRERAAAISSAE
jgi:DNA repair photolyase